ncbi:MAG TPA: xanthine dehydrogenase family protein molybdopterin-binding subunit [Planctomycetota bacterium]|jgi:xanthine dehydrogenase YagR molybdenum-binding subunit|nr:xanthine dehydrogenase family protein molybdopterin-binding subunit [Planctomycetota bacterium]
MAERKPPSAAAWPPRAELTVLNHDLPRVDGPAKVSGRARYTHDVRLPGMLYARVLCCPLPCAEVTLDLAPARKIPGVEGVIELMTGKTGYLGQPVAAVAARTPEQAEDGLRAIVLTLVPKPWAVDHAQATAEGAPKAGRNGNVSKENVAGDAKDAEAAIAGADAVVEATYTLPVQHHACLETHGVVVDYRGGDQATVYCSTQGTFTVLDDAPGELGLKSSQVTAIVDHMGGGFGSKFGIGIEGKAACMLSKQLGKPVHLMFDRADEFVTAGNRSGSRQTLRAGASRDGKLLGFVGDVTKLGGTGGGSFPGGRPYIYSFEKSCVRVRSVYTHTDSARAMRAPGHPQASFAMESLVDELAAKLAIDPLEFRKRNLKDPVYRRHLDAVAREIGWPDHPNKTAPAALADGIGVGIGFAVSTWGGGGGDGCEVDVRIDRDGSVVASVGTQDLGTGVRTYVAAIVAEEFGLPLDAVVARIGDSRLASATPSGGSTTTASLAPSVKNGAAKLRGMFAERLAKTMGVDEARLRFAGGRVADEQDAKKSLSWQQACAVLGQEGLSARGTHQSDLAANGIHGAQAAKVRVDTLTGRIEVLKMVCMQDCGLPLNRMAIRSQIQGGMVQALSYGLLEERVIDPQSGWALNANLEDYKIAHPLEIPEMVALVDDEDARGVIGLAEATVIPGHGAIANAVFNACGARIRDLPMTPDKVLAALGKVG